MPSFALYFAALALCTSALSQNRAYTVVLPELQYSGHCVSEAVLSNLSLRFVDVEIVGHRSNGGLLGLVGSKSNRLRLAPSARVLFRLDVEDDIGWAEVIEIVPSPRLRPVLSVSGKTECLDGNELLTVRREIAALTANPHFSLDPSTVAAKGGVLLLINVSDTSLHWSACYSAGHTVSNGQGEMTPLCSTTEESTLAPYQSWRVMTAMDGKQLVRFSAAGPAVALQFFAPTEPKVNLFHVESRITF